MQKTHAKINSKTSKTKLAVAQPMRTADSKRLAMVPQHGFGVTPYYVTVIMFSMIQCKEAELFVQNLGYAHNTNTYWSS
jgi:hypothetical protein